MVFNIEQHERKIFEIISEAAGKLGYPAFVVGGYVRDRLLARPSKDMDIVCVGDGIALAHAVAGQLRPIPRITVYKRFGTAMLKHRDLEIEFVGARKESYRSDSRKPMVEAGTLEEDQNRRDFTINALAVSLNKSDYGSIIDPFNGLHHLESKTIQTPLEPGKTFSDDPLRMMRAIRFATQLGFEIAPATYQALKDYNARINIISKERITTELNKIILSPTPSLGFKHLFDTGLLQKVFPEMAALQGVEVRNGKAHKDNFYHTLEVLDNLSRNTDNLWLRWSAILHDIAKPPTKRFHPQQGWTFHGHEALGASMVPRIFKNLRLPLDHKMKYVQKLVRLHLRPISLTKENITDSAIRRLLFEAGDDIDDLMMLCEADITSKNPKKVKRYLENYEMVRERLQEVEEKDHLRNWQPPISGETIMNTFGISPCREVGIIKNAIREAILDGDIANEYEEALAFMLAKGKEIGLSPKA
ncbi:CCA tRNA nucleotidyltransferase [Phaeodactylibacter luteus]|uniref:HD domain-containing protein n=1 Tax=Phaeodactylibacter luteus TaxID=1564516 RepID=A0A5C6RMM7_9BACT|nr:HD domain-containing protein [Phaeodactylibacter luteus]TXB63463.1 HD domain-containing protein [Phaeodactylibacter luteus]